MATSDLPPEEKVDTPFKAAWRKRVAEQTKRKEGYPVLCCGTCGEILINKKTTSKCRNNCNNTEIDPIIKNFHYYEHNGSYTDFCEIKEVRGIEIPIFKPAMAAKWYKANFLFLTDRISNILYYYDPDNHKWSKHGRIFLHALLAEAMGIEYTEYAYKNTLDALKATTKIDVEFSDKIALENGLLDPATGDSTEFSPNDMPFYSIPVRYDKTKISTLWLNFVSQVVSPEDAMILQEWAGYTLLPSYPKHKFAFVYGKGRNGKGVYDRTIQGELGPDNCISLRLEELNGDRRFSLARFYGKLYCSSPEPLVTKELQTQILKSLTGQDRIDAELKGQQETLRFCNCAKVTVYGNRYPKVNDNTDAFYDRLEIIEFPNHFGNEDSNDEIEKLWLDSPDDRSGILNWMLEGLQRLLTQKTFSTSKSQQQKVLELKRISDPFSAFIQEKTEFVKNAIVSRADLYSAFLVYCDDIGAKADAAPKFTQAMQKLPKVKDKQIKKPKSERVWEGIVLRNDPSEENQTQLSTDSTDSTPPIPPEENEMSYNMERVEGSKGVESVESVDQSLLGRLCSEECQNFRTPKCSANGYYRSEESEIPSHCPGYEQVHEVDQE